MAELRLANFWRASTRRAHGHKAPKLGATKQRLTKLASVHAQPHDAALALQNTLHDLARLTQKRVAARVLLPNKGAVRSRLRRDA